MLTLLNIHPSVNFQVADAPQKRKKGVFGTKGGDKDVSCPLSFINSTELLHVKWIFLPI